MRALYSLLYALCLPLVLPWELRKRPRGQRLRWLRERLALPLQGLPEEAVWVHAVSVGEVAAAVPLVEALQGQGHRVLLSTVTHTGRQVALERLKAVGHFYAPFDLPWLIRRVLGRLRPRALLIMETELWPNLIAEAQKAGLPICLINGRLSERSFGRYLQVRPFMKRLLGGFRLLCVQEPLYAQRFMALGAPEEAVRVVGNLKFELTPRGRPPRWLEYLRDDLVVVAGSTHRGEEALLGEVFSRLRGEFHSLRLLVAPRHPERLPQIEEELRPLAPQRASSMTPHAKVVLLDEMGVLMHAYSVASVAVVGGSFIPHGGQNPLEPAYWAKAVLAGPHMENFPFFKDMLQEGAALSCSAQSLAETLGRLLREPALRQEMGRRARRFYEARSGALDRTLQALKEVLG